MDTVINLINFLWGIPLTIIIILIGIYFSYNIVLTWDTSEYLGLSDLIGTNKIKDVDRKKVEKKRR